MKSKTIPVTFIIIAVLLSGVFFITKKYLSKPDESKGRAKLVLPLAMRDSDKETGFLKNSSESERYETFVPLYLGETLIGTTSFDINNDGYDDEVIVIKKSGSDYLWLIPGLYNPETGDYERSIQMETNFTKTRTFSYSGMDIIGDHKNSLIYQGLNDDGVYILKIFVFDNVKKDLRCIGDFQSDGTIFVQQMERSESYELGISKGESFSVWIYKSDVQPQGSDEKSAALSTNQIQEEYVWNPGSKMYELSRTIKVSANRLLARELSRIQDGTVETFASFLNGLWYKTSNTQGNIRYLYFDYDSREIIQLYGDIQEVYAWEDSRIRHNGIYLTTVNQDIMNLHRRFDISLLGPDEIKLSLRDDINLVIKETTLWDGQYKKMSLQSSFNDNAVSELEFMNQELKKGPVWASQESSLKLNFDGMSYVLHVDEFMETGVYTTTQIGNYKVIQFRSDSPTSSMNEFYAMEFNVKTVSETVRRQIVEKIVPDYDNITFTPVKITPTDCFATEGRSFIFTRENR